MTRMTRRRFLGQSLASVGSTASVARAGARSSTLGGLATGVLGANEKIRVALVGSGGMGRGDMATFLQFDDVDCPVVCDVDEAMIAKGIEAIEKKRSKRPEAVKDFRRVMDRKDVDAVLVGTPDHWHALPTIHACQAGKDVYVEKPLATSVAEELAMVAAARKHERVVQMGTQWRSGEHFGQAVEYVHSGKLGKIRQVRCWAYLTWAGDAGKTQDCAAPKGVDYDLWLGPAPKRPFNPARFHFKWRWFWDYAGGLMTDWGVHLINLAMWGMQAKGPTRVNCAGGKYKLVDDLSETPDTQCATYDFPDFMLIWEHHTRGGFGPEGREHGVAFWGTEAKLVLDRHGWEVIPLDVKKLPAEKHTARDNSRPAHVRDFLDCIRSRKRPVEDVEIGHRVSTIAHLGNVALRSGRSIRWDAEHERVIGDEEAAKWMSRPYRAPWKLPG
ncbi:MAG: Gfo/Idh/MocA family oxidoreductase [Phycisphaerae bacterium]|nr:Gfo/Idh/MocA family oxidoreductase [Phycisphaerae bacterium]